MTRDSDSAKRPLSRRQFVGGALLSAGWLTLALAGCAPNATEQTEESATTDEQEHGSVSTQAEAMSTTPTENAARQLVLVFSRAGENYNVGTVETGNTMVIAQMIEERTGADLFELKPEEPYPSSYDETLDRARQEQSANARPALEALPDFSQYDFVYLGFPIWWGDAPMPLYTAIESLDWNGKTVAPFNTHAGSGDAGMFSKLRSLCAGATVLEGLSIAGTVAQNDREEAQTDVDEWLSAIGQ